MWDDLWTKHQKTIWFVVGMVCFLTAGYVVVNLPQAKKQAQTPAPRAAEMADVSASGVSEPEAEIEAAAGKPDESEWVVYITGAVRRPGVYGLPVGSRLLQLVEAAGGLNNFADPVAINLAAVLDDGLHVHVPKKGEPPVHWVYGGAVLGTTGGLPSAPARRMGLVDINRASAEELTVLKGVGPVLAGSIVEYRLKNGHFHSVDDLLHVKGIGHKKLEQFRDSVTVGP